MKHVHFNKDWHYNGYQILRLENDFVSIEILPELGGKIYRWIDKRQKRDYLWQHPRIKPAIVPETTNYDDTFSGGWDELFPNGGACQHAGEFYPDHGEYWTKRFEWSVEESADAITLRLSAQGAVTPTRIERFITVATGSPKVDIRYKVTNLGSFGFDYLWAIHPALAVNANCELFIPASKGLIASPGMGRFAKDASQFNWPHVPSIDGSSVDFSKIPSHPVPNYEMVYLTELKAGWYAMIDHASRSGFGMTFDQKIFNSAWVFQTHGGWRGLHTVIVEPSTGYPYDLAEAATTGRCARLEAGQVLETQVTVVVFENRERIENIDSNGTVT